MGKIRKTFKILTEKDDKKRYKKIKSLKKAILSIYLMCVFAVCSNTIFPFPRWFPRINYQATPMRT